MSIRLNEREEQTWQRLIENLNLPKSKSSEHVTCIGRSIHSLRIENSSPRILARILDSTFEFVEARVRDVEIQDTQTGN